MSVTKLQKTGVIQILLYLHKHEKASRTDLRDNVDAVLDTIYATSLPTLKESGLIQETKEKKFPFKVEIYLTEKGKVIAAYIQKIDDELKSSS